ncbi:MAG: ABC transporter substrate-binding protein [Candidatus Omnitrophica bacterium]|nr:ABC transporter substrate-binding protein [Candidatus Omnitrophota bacterium]HOX54564.1 ABC transporter substrate-binding protein [Candidatus Omnitrophota bacterium]
MKKQDKKQNNNNLTFLNNLKKLPFVAVVFLFIFVCISGFAESDKYGGQIVLATTSDPRSFNPVLAKETSTTAITGIIFEGLTRTNGETLEIEPNLAESWEIRQDGLSWVFRLRNDVFWTDGKKFTADDVIFTFNELIYNPNIPNSSRDIFTIEGKTFQLKKIDDYTVEFILPVKFAPFLRSMSQEILPKHALENAVKQNKFNFTWGTDTSPKDIIGTGPYQLKEYFPGERIVLEKNPRYWRVSKDDDRLPYIEKIIYLIVQSQDTDLLKFQDGEIDYYGLRGSDYPLLKPQEKTGNFTIYDTGASFGSNFLVFNLNTSINPKTGRTYIDKNKLSWFLNIDFRKAVAHAIDKQKIIEILMNGLGYEQNSSMSQSSGYFYNPNVTKYNYDLDKAKEILKNAGFFDRNNDGIIEDKDGNKVEFNLFTNSGSTERIQIASIIRKDLQNLGMKVNFMALEFNNLVSKLTSTFDWDAIIIGLTGGIEPHFGKNVWDSSGQLHMWHPKQAKPDTEWEKRVDGIFNQGVQELNDKKRKVLYDEWQYIISEELPVIYTVLPASIFAVRNKFGNLKPTPYGGAFHNLEEIYIKKECRK